MKKHKCKWCGGMTIGNDADCYEKPPHVKSSKDFNWFHYWLQVFQTSQMPFENDKKL